MSDIGLQKSPYPPPGILEKFKWLTGSLPSTWTDYYLLITIALAVLVLVRGSSESGKSPALDLFAYWSFSLAYIGFAAFRPMGTAIDDHGYLLKFEQICPLTVCGYHGLIQRDILWYGIIGGLKAIYPYPEVMLWLSGVTLAIKLWLIHRFTERKMLALLAYVCIFYLVDDLTALRASLADAFFMLAFIACVQKKPWRASSLMLASGLAHVQGFLSFALLLGRRLCNYQGLLLILIIVLMTLTMLGIHPTEGFIRVIMQYPIGKWIANPSGMDIDVFLRVLEFKPHGVRSVPIVIPPLVFLLAYVGYIQYPLRLRLIGYSYVSIAISCFIIWFYAYSPVEQIRFSDPFLLVLVFIVGHVPDKDFLKPVIVAVCLGFLVKYNVIHTGLFDGSLIEVASSDGGRVTKEYTQFYNTVAWYDMDTASIKAIPDVGYEFDEWAGDCSGHDPVCHLSVYKPAKVTARFVRAVRLNIVVEGAGTVVSDKKDIYCSKECTKSLPVNSSLILRPKSTSGWQLKEWSGGCEGEERDCVISMDSDKTVVGHFVKRYAITLIISGSGSAYRFNDRIECSERCVIHALDGAKLVINAVPAQGYRLQGWEGACTHQDSACEFMVTGSSTLYLRFVPDGPSTLPDPQVQ